MISKKTEADELLHSAIFRKGYLSLSVSLFFKNNFLASQLKKC
jgi:hypothetical protein